MRVIAGRYRGRRLLAPTGRDTRPILDRVKVSLFDWLGARFGQPGTLPPLTVLDLFCGGGSLGIEALSRGAESCVFVEADSHAFQCLLENLNALGMSPTARVFNHPAESVNIALSNQAVFDLIFLDPPYHLSETITPASVLGRVIARLGADIPVAPGVLAVWRHRADCGQADFLPGGWKSSERRTWGTMAVTMLERLPEVPS